MKRTQERWNNPHPHWQDRAGVSGAKEFDGEDLSYDSRVKYFQMQQKRWLDEQVRQNNQKKHQEKNEENLYAQQTLEITRMRGMLEDDFSQKKSNLLGSTKDYNLDLAEEKKQNEENERQQKLADEKAELARLHQRGMKKPYP